MIHTDDVGLSFLNSKFHEGEQGFFLFQILTEKERF